MGVSSSIQFYGIGPVITGYKNNDVDAWSISQGKQFLFKGVGLDELTAVLGQMQNSGSQSIYTLRVYEDIEDKKKIKESTPADGSFNFRLCDSDPDWAGTRSLGMGGFKKMSEDNAVLAKLEEISKRLEKVEAGEVEEEKNTSLGIIGEIMQHPAIEPHVPKILDIIGNFLQQKTGTPPQQIEQYTPVPQYRQPATLNGIDQDKIINEAIERLKQKDANLGPHLQKLALIAETEPATFQMLLNMLDS